MPNNAFQPMGNTFLVTTNGTTLTPSAQVVQFAKVRAAAQDTGLFLMPPQVRVQNQSAGPVYISFTTNARVAAVPGANPSLEVPIAPNSERILTLPQGPAADGTLQINTIAVGVAAVLAVTFGEGL